MSSSVKFQLVIAGENRTISSTSLRQYATRKGTKRTLDEYDERAGAKSDDVLTCDDVKATRRISSRISEAEADWFVKRASDAPWRDVPRDSCLADADASVRGELYDSANGLYMHFRTRPRKGVAIGKVSKVLYLMRPHLVPIVDSQLRSRYRNRAREIAKQIGSDSSHTWWEAVRRDLIDPTTESGLGRIREWAAEADLPQLVGLSDVRLLDVAVWESTRNT